MMITTTTDPPTQPSLLQRNAYSQYHTTKVTSMMAFTLPEVMPLMSTPDTMFAPSPRRTVSDIAEEALRLSREVLNEEIRAFIPKVEDEASLKGLVSSQALLATAGVRLNKFVKRLHDMLQSEKDSGIVEWRKGLLVLHSTDSFAKHILPKYFNTRNFKTFRRQLNYYGFVHVRSFSNTGSTTTALWVNQDLAQKGSDDIASVLMLKRVEPCESAKTAEGRRVRKELAIHTVEEDLGVNAKTLQIEQIRSMAIRGGDNCVVDTSIFTSVPAEIEHPKSSGAHSVSSASSSSDDQPGSESTESSASALSAAAPPSDQESASAANLLLLLSKA